MLYDIEAHDVIFVKHDSVLPTDQVLDANVKHVIKKHVVACNADGSVFTVYEDGKTSLHVLTEPISPNDVILCQVPCQELGCLVLRQKAAQTTTTTPLTKLQSTVAATTTTLPQPNAPNAAPDPNASNTNILIATPVTPSDKMVTRPTPKRDPPESEPTLVQGAADPPPRPSKKRHCQDSSELTHRTLTELRDIGAVWKEYTTILRELEHKTFTKWRADRKSTAMWNRKMHIYREIARVANECGSVEVAIERTQQLLDERKRHSSMGWSIVEFLAKKNKSKTHELDRLLRQMNVECTGPTTCAMRPST